MNSDSRFILITGLSGAGKTQVLRFFEDHGYYCVDNLPPALIPTFAELLLRVESANTRIALCVDARTGEDLQHLPKYLKTVADYGFKPQTLYLDTQDDILHQRYSETRRPHPSSPTGSIREGIQRERELLDGLRELADVVIDTSGTSSAELSERLATIALNDGEQQGLTVGVISFGFKYGLPKEADLVLDVRFLPNPYYEPDLRPRDGREPEVREFVLHNDSAKSFLDHASKFMRFLMPQYEREPKSYLTIGIGCTGGRHRSVAVAQEIADLLSDLGHAVTLSHRDIERNP